MKRSESKRPATPLSTCCFCVAVSNDCCLFEIVSTLSESFLPSACHCGQTIVLFPLRKLLSDCCELLPPVGDFTEILNRFPYLTNVTVVDVVVEIGGVRILVAT